MSAGGKREGAGRPKGSLNKLNGDVRAMIIGALEAEGGIEYLRKRANDQPVAFMSLLGRILPLQVAGPGGGALRVDFRWADAPQSDVATAVVTPIIEAAVAAETSEDETALIEWEAPKSAND